MNQPNYCHHLAMKAIHKQTYADRTRNLEDKFLAEQIFRQGSGFKWRLVTLTFKRSQPIIIKEAKRTFENYDQRLRRKFPDRVYHYVWEGGISNTHIHLVEGTAAKAIHKDYRDAWDGGFAHVKMLDGTPNHNATHIMSYFQKEQGTATQQLGQANGSRGFGTPPLLVQHLTDLLTSLTDADITKLLLLPRNIPLASVLTNVTASMRPDLVKGRTPLNEFKYDPDANFDDHYEMRVALDCQHEKVQAFVKSIAATVNANRGMKK